MSEEDDAEDAMTARKCMALIAHDLKKQDMAEFAKAHESVLADWRIVATGTTGGRVQEACPGLDVTRLATVYDIPMALNRATAERLVDFRPL